MSIQYLCVANFDKSSEVWSELNAFYTSKGWSWDNSTQSWNKGESKC